MRKKAIAEDLSSVMDCFTVDTTQAPFDLKSIDNKRKHKRKFCEEVFQLFENHGLRYTEDCVSCLDYCKKELGCFRKPLEVQAEHALKKQLDRLALPERNLLIPLLTHLDDEVNEDMLTLFPSIEERSRKLLEDLVNKHQRKERDDKIDLTLVSEFMHDYCRLNTFASKVIVGKDPETGLPIEHNVHEYSNTLREIYTGEFLHSEYYEELLQVTGRTSISFTKFKEGALMCKCIKAPTMRVCVDEIETTVAELVYCLKEIRRRSRGQCACTFCTNERAREEQLGDDYCHPLSSPVSILDHLMCPKIIFPCREKNGQRVVKASVFRKACSDSTCGECREFAASDSSIFFCPTIFSEDTVYHWREYQTHILDNGNPIKELRDMTGLLDNFLEKFNNAIKKYKLHYFQYRWLNLNRKVDFFELDKHSLFIMSDYGAQPVLDSQEKLNSVGHGVCVLQCWLILYSPREAYYFDKKSKTDIRYRYYESDHIRVVTPATGKHKDQDWFLHCKVFEYLLSHYKSKLPLLNKVMLWTDGAPNQYKCRQNFYWVANVFDKFGITMVHRFGATAQFKGVHDKIGQVAKWTVRNRERLKECRVSNAYEFYQAVKKYCVLKEKTYLFQKKEPFEATSYMIFYVAANTEEAVGKEHIFALDRINNMWDCTGVLRSSSAYEFYGGPGSTISMRYLPCPCAACSEFNFVECTNQDIVGRFEVQRVSLIDTAVHEVLTEPLENYKNAELVAFMKRNRVKAPRVKSKPGYISAIRGDERIRHLIIPAAVVD